MRTVRLLLVSIVLCTVFGCSSKDVTCERDKQNLLARAESVTEAFNRADAQTIVDMMYPTVVRSLGGRERTIATADQATAEMAARGLRLDRFSLGQPTKTYHDGKKSLCFIPREMIMSMGTTKTRNIGYLVAIHDVKESPDWTFLDSNVFNKNPRLLWQMFPGLPPDVEQPPSRNEPM
jgi:hypothetical protein